MRTLLAVPFFIGLGCNPVVEQSQEEQVQVVKVSSPVSDIVQSASVDEIFDRIELQEIKKRYAASVTSGVLGQKASQVFQDSGSNQKLGAYFFSINDQKPTLRPYVLKATVSFTGEWKYDTSEEQLQELIVYAPNVINSVLDVGESVNVVIDRMGEPALQNESCMFFTQGRSVLTARVKNDSIAAYKIGKYSIDPDSILFSILCSHF